MKLHESRLTAAPREKLGTRASRKLRLQGRVPASIQGESKPTLHFSLDEDEFLAARRGHAHLFDIDLGGGTPEAALVRELSWNAFGDRIVHVEFRRVLRDRETEVEVELEFVGHPKGGILHHLVTHLTIVSLPVDIPDAIEVKVDHMEIGKPLLAKDIVLPPRVRLAIPAETLIASVTTKATTAPIEPEVAAAEAAPVEGEVAVPAAAGEPKAEKAPGEKPEKVAERPEKGPSKAKE
jgi:large subunit ribosomal protein L25